MIGITGESLSPRTSNPIFCSSDLKKLLFSRICASFWAPTQTVLINASKKAKQHAIQRGDQVPAKPRLEPSSPRITFMDDIICWAAGGEIEVA